MPEVSPSKYLVMAGWDDVPHLTEQAKRELLAATPVHLRKARAFGIPTQGSGAVFATDEELMRWKAQPIPAHWPRLAGIDFGFTHPTAVIWYAWDRDADTTYLYDCYRVRGALAPVHAAAINARGKWIPVAWPHDGENDTAVGSNLAQQYRELGVNMLPERAQFDLTGVVGETERSRVSVEAGIADMQTRMETGRFRVAEHLNDWWEEYRMYHREEGKIVKEDDDLMCASRYGLMMLRYAATAPKPAVITRGRTNWRAM